MPMCYGQGIIFDWVMTPPSASIIGSGGCGVSFHSDDPLSVYYNPANVGLSKGLMQDFHIEINGHDLITT